MSTQKNHCFLVYPKKNLTPFFTTQKNPPACFFLRPTKVLASFIDPKKSLLAKISDPKNSLGAPPPTPIIKICEWGPWGIEVAVVRYSAPHFVKKEQLSMQKQILHSMVNPGAPLTNFNDREGGGGGGSRGSHFIHKKITTSEFVYPKKSLFFSIPKKKPYSFFHNPKKSPSLFFFATHKSPGVFHRPKKITFGQNFRPKKLTWGPPLPPSLKYVSGAPGVLKLLS